MKKIIYVLCFVSSLLISVNQTHADSKKSGKGNSEQKKQIYQTIKQIEQAQKKLARQFNKLSAAAKEDVIAKTSTKVNSDTDLLNDYLEGALKLNKCSDDSDDDGTSDDGEYEDDSSDDNQSTQFEVHKTIQSIDSTSVVLDGIGYVLNQQTKLLDDDKNVVSLDFFTVGKCVEAEGYISGDAKIVEKLKEDDDC